MKVIHLARKPCAEKTLAKNALKWGTGGLNIDQTRVTSGSDADSDGVQRHKSGRWPANFILQHLPGCLIVGTSTDTFGGGRKGTSGFAAGYAGGDGFVGQTVSSPIYACVPGCPAAQIDAQSGSSQSSRGSANQAEGAARYFKQFRP